jgi:Rieske Fe-S protein
MPPADSRPIDPGRRSFLDALVGSGFLSTVVAIGYPVWRYLIPPRGGEPTTISVVATQASQIKPGTGIIFKFGSRPGLLIRTADGELRAFNAICTHLECTVQYKSDTAQIWCPCHNGLFDLAGNVISGPPPRPLERLVVNQRGEDVVVSRS